MAFNHQSFQGLILVWLFHKIHHFACEKMAICDDYTVFCITLQIDQVLRHYCSYLLAFYHAPSLFSYHKICFFVVRLTKRVRLRKNSIFCVYRSRSSVHTDCNEDARKLQTAYILGKKFCLNFIYFFDSIIKETFPPVWWRP